MLKINWGENGVVQTDDTIRNFDKDETFLVVNI